MGLRNDQTIVASTIRVIKKALVTGKIDSVALSKINYFNMLDYYICFTQETIDNGFDGYKDINKGLLEAIRRYTYCNSDDICNYKLSGNHPSNLRDFLASNATETIDTINIRISQLQI